MQNEKREGFELAPVVKNNFKNINFGFFKNERKLITSTICKRSVRICHIANVNTPLISSFFRKKKKKSDSIDKSFFQTRCKSDRSSLLGSWIKSWWCCTSPCLINLRSTFFVTNKIKIAFQNPFGFFNYLMQYNSGCIHSKYNCLIRN